MNLKVISLLAGMLMIPAAMAGENIIRTFAPIKGVSSHITPKLDLHEAHLADGMQGKAYLHSFSGAAYWVVPPKGQIPEFAWSAAVPAGLSLSSAGVLSGTPSASGIFEFPVTVQAAGKSATRTYALNIAAAIEPKFALYDVQLPAGQKNTPYTYDFSGLAEWIVLPAEGTDLAFIWSAVTPPGLTMSAAGVLSGTPTTYGDLTVSITAMGGGKTERRDYLLTVNSPAAQLELVDAALDQGMVSGAYHYDLSPLAHWVVAPKPGDVTPFTWTAVSLPPGLSLSSAGLISGKPSTPGDYTVAVTVTGSGKTATHSYALKVSAPLTMMCKEFKAASPGAASGVYTLRLNGSQFNAYCEMASDGGGWTLVGRGAPGAPGSWATSNGDLNLPATPNPNSTVSFKFADATINAMPKSAYKVLTTGYNNQRYFKPSCAYNNLATPKGDCAISYSTDSWTDARGNGLSIAGAGGLADNRGSVANDGFFVLTSYSGYPTHGWGAGNGTTATYAGTGIAGTVVGQTIWVR